MDFARAEKKRQVWGCVNCPCKQIKKYAIKHYLKMHVCRDDVSYTCSACDYVSLIEKENEAHKTWYGPHKNTQLEGEIRRSETPFQWKDGYLVRWEQAASVSYWLHVQQQKERDDKQKDLVELIDEVLEAPCEPPAKLNEPVVSSIIENITPQLLEGFDTAEVETKDTGSNVYQILTEIRDEIKAQGERQFEAINKQTEAILQLNKTLYNYFYSNGPKRGLTPQPKDRAQTPEMESTKRNTSTPRRTHLRHVPLTGQCCQKFHIRKKTIDGSDPPVYLGIQITTRHQDYPSTPAKKLKSAVVKK